MRTLLVLAALCPIASSWLSVRLQHLKRQREAIVEIESSGGLVFYDYQVSRNGLTDSPDWNQVPPGPNWLRRWLGDDFFATVVGMESIRGRNHRRQP